MLQDDGTKPVHFPADPKLFKFDSEVSAIFPDMAVRSIPNFLEAHAAHARMIQEWMVQGVRILDVGASRGHFLKAVKNHYRGFWNTSNVFADALDNSEDMLAHLRNDMPEVQTMLMDLTGYEFARHQPQFPYDVICVNYVLQFLPPPDQIRVLLKLISLLRPGGVFILGHKSAIEGKAAQAQAREYIRFRLDNNYSMAEINAKTEALKGSMFPMTHESVLGTLRLHCTEVTETFRFMMFSTIFAVK